MTQETTPLWSSAGDACPACGSTNTMMINFRQGVRPTPTLGGQVYTQTERPTYTLRCNACGHTEQVDGVPGQAR